MKIETLECLKTNEKIRNYGLVQCQLYTNSNNKSDSKKSDFDVIPKYLRLQATFLFHLMWLPKASFFLKVEKLI